MGKQMNNRRRENSQAVIALLTALHSFRNEKDFTAGQFTEIFDSVIEEVDTRSLVSLLSDAVITQMAKVGSLTGNTVPEMLQFEGIRTALSENPVPKDISKE